MTVHSRIQEILSLLCLVCVAVSMGTGQENKAAKFPTPTFGLGSRVQDFAKLAKKADPAATSLYRQLSIPHDIVVVKGKTWKVVPARKFLDVPSKSNEKIQFEVLGDKKSEREVKAFPLDTITEFKPYEEIALERVDQFLANAKTGTLAKWPVAQNVLVAVLRFHEASRHHPFHGPTRWDAKRRALQSRLVEIRVGYLESLRSLATSKKDREEAAMAWDVVQKFATELEQLHGAKPSVRTQISASRFAFVEYLLAGSEPTVSEYIRVRKLLPELAQLPDPKGKLRAITQQLTDKAKAIYAEAKAIEIKKPKGQTRKENLLEDALAIWPAFPGVRDELLKLRGTYRILRVGVPELPKNLLPGQATTETEKQILELLYEPLIRQEYNAKLGQQYRAVLVQNVPNVFGRMLQFRLRPSIRWSDGTKVSDAAVRTSWDDAAGFRKEMISWSSSSPFEVRFRIAKDTFDPLSLLTFYVTGKAISKEAVPRKLGTGPFVYKGLEEADGRVYAVFTANPYYVNRGKIGYSSIREIRFYVPSDPVADYFGETNPPDMHLGLSGREVVEIRKRAKKHVNQLRNRRVFFLAVNHKNVALDDVTRRQGLSAAIDRRTVLDLAFRGSPSLARELDVLGVGMAVARDVLERASLRAHAELNGPFPAGSWAVAPEVPKQLYNPDRARTLLKRAGKTSGPLALRLAYPSNDEQVEKACRLIASQIEKVSDDLTIKLVPMSPQQLRDALSSGEYDLAYTSRAYVSEFYWLWPLFDPNATDVGGSNFLRYKNDARLTADLLSRMTQTDFRDIRRTTHEVHARLNERVPLVPLWQLDTFVVVRPGVRTDIDDPLHIFRNVAAWTVRR